MDLEKLIDINKNLIYKIASKFYGVEKDDLFQAGVMGLIKAYKNYKKNAETKFSTYAYEYIYGEMYLLAQNKNIKVNKDVLKLYKLIEKTRYKLAQKYDRVPSNMEISSFLNISLDMVENAIIAGKEMVFLDDDENSNYIDRIPVLERVSIDDKILLDEGMQFLDKKEKDIIKARFIDDLTQMEVAKKLGFTQVMVSRYEKKGLTKMYEFMQK